MSDTFTSIVPINPIEKEAAENLAEKVQAWLSARKIIADSKTDCSLGESGYPPAENYESILIEKDPQLLELYTNGLEIISERHIFHNGGFDVEQILCSKCGADIIDQDWQNALGEWLEDSETANITCPECKNHYSIAQYQFIPEWGFNQFGLTFWNWNEFNSKFIQDLEALIGGKVKIIRGRI